MLTDCQRAQIVALHNSGMSWKDVVQEMHEKYMVEVTVRTCKRIGKKWNETQSVSDLPRSGRPRLLDSRGQRILRRAAFKNRKLSYRQLGREVAHVANRVISKWTVMRALRRMGIRRYVAVKRAKLTRRMKRNRWLWSRQYVNWSLYKWKSVIFSDEKIFRFDSNSLRVFVTRLPEEKYSKECIHETVKNGIEVHVWGCVSWNGVGRLKLVRTTLNAERYQNEIINDLPDMAAQLAGEGRKFIFQQDGAPAHRARTTIAFLEARNISVLPWCGNSPDMSLIENLWSQAQRAVNVEGVKNQHDFFAAVERAWSTLRIEYIHALYRSMPSRLKELKKRRGGHTHY
jgi:transposase